MSVDFPRAWEIARAVPTEVHDPQCSYAQTASGMLCDCWVLTKHAEYLDDSVMHGAGGVVIR